MPSCSHDILIVSLKLSLACIWNKLENIFTSLSRAFFPNWEMLIRLLFRSLLLRFQAGCTKMDTRSPEFPYRNFIFIYSVIFPFCFDGKLDFFFGSDLFWLSNMYPNQFDFSIPYPSWNIDANIWRRIFLPVSFFWSQYHNSSHHKEICFCLFVIFSTYHYCGWPLNIRYAVNKVLTISKSSLLVVFNLRFETSLTACGFHQMST